MGGGIANNDGRFMTSVGDYTAGTEGALDFPTSLDAAATEQPFFMVISLVNPHDVLAYPRHFTEAGYSDLWLEATSACRPVARTCGSSRGRRRSS